jgi:hypothetical protein
MFACHSQFIQLYSEICQYKGLNFIINISSVLIGYTRFSKGAKDRRKRDFTVGQGKSIWS